MTDQLSPAELGKRAAAAASVTHIKDGMTVGLGTGSTAAWMVRLLGERVRNEGLKIRGVPTSSRTAALAREEGIEVITLEEAGWLDLTIDGADEFDPSLNLIKGGGGAHLQEMIVATSSDRMIVITDPSKEVETLGAFPLPVEITRFGWQQSRRRVEAVVAATETPGQVITLRGGEDSPFVTDEGNYILDLHLGRIDDPAALSAALNAIPGVVEPGLFLNICDLVIIGHEDGHAETRQRLDTSL